MVVLKLPDSHVVIPFPRDTCQANGFRPELLCYTDGAMLGIRIAEAVGFRVAAGGLFSARRGSSSSTVWQYGVGNFVGGAVHAQEGDFIAAEFLRVGGAAKIVGHAETVHCGEAAGGKRVLVIVTVRGEVVENPVGLCGGQREDGRQKDGETGWRHHFDDVRGDVSEKVRAQLLTRPTI